MGLNEIPIIFNASFAPGAGQALFGPDPGKRIKLLGGEISVDADSVVDINIRGAKLGPGILPANGGSKVAVSGPIVGDIDEDLTIDISGGNAEVRLQYVLSD